MIIALVLFGVATPIIAALHSWIVAAWTSHVLVVPGMLTIGLASWTIVEGMALPFATFMNGCGKIRPQAIASTVSAITFLPAKILALKYWGLSGMVFVSTAFFVFNTVIFYFLIFRREVFEPLGGEADCIEETTSKER
jgi:hypothetical protein